MHLLNCNFIIEIYTPVVPFLCKYIWQIIQSIRNQLTWQMQVEGFGGERFHGQEEQRRR